MSVVFSIRYHCVHQQTHASTLYAPADTYNVQKYYKLEAINTDYDGQYKVQMTFTENVKVLTVRERYYITQFIY
jgi:hypothetical protein